ncbi:MAG: 3-dehydroquinate synthase [Ardenticatenaceae bacterium]|nr:3-dehydroquinate synthase [Ardenticatenaceae bacterium]
MSIRELLVNYPTGEYAVKIGVDLLSCTADFAQISGSAVIVTDDRVGPLYADQLSNCLSKAPIVTVPSGEQHKNLQTVSSIYDRLFELGIDRQATLVALGGGVINDMAGFVAATFMRGIKFVTCPTSLLAMVDASVGGKTGVDMPQGKNLVGAFKQPEVVVVDLAVLESLPAVELRCGVAEIIKHGLISDPNLLTEVQLSGWDLGQKADFRTERLQNLVADAIQVKRDVVEADPFERGERAHLNLGHTFGHAIEQVSGYAVRHGEGVAIGLVCAAHLSAALGYCPPDLQQFIEKLLDHVGLPKRIPSQYDPELIYKAMFQDKKKAGRSIRFILLRGIGQPIIDGDVPSSMVLETLTALRG